MKSKFKKGDVVEIIGNCCRSHEFKIGENVRIVQVLEDYYKAEYLDGSDFWYVLEEDIKPALSIKEILHTIVKDVENSENVLYCYYCDSRLQMYRLAFELLRMGFKASVKEKTVNEKTEYKIRISL